MADPSFGAIGEILEGSGAGPFTLTLTGVTAGDLIFVLVQRDNQDDITGVACSSPSVSLTLLETALSGQNDFWVQLWGAIAPSTGSYDLVVSYSDAEDWFTGTAFRYNPGSITSITPQETNAHTTLQNETTNRTCPNITTSTRTLMLACGTDWNYYNDHSASGSWTLRMAANTNGDAGVQFIYDLIDDAGTYPNGNYGTADEDQPFAMIVALEIEAAGTTHPTHSFPLGMNHGMAIRMP